MAKSFLLINGACFLLSYNRRRSVCIDVITEVWSVVVSEKISSYYTTITGSAKAVAQTAQASVDAIKKIAAGEISSKEVSKAKAAAKFKELEHGQDIRAGLELTSNSLIHNTQPYQIDEVAKKIDSVTEEAVKKAAKELLENTASVSSVGDLFVLPYAADLGLKV